MREIKFRAWFKNEGEMKNVAINNVYEGNKTYLHLSPMPFSDYKPIELMQYVGLKDKNGREIYEGDIVNVNQYGGTPRLEQMQFYTTGSGFADIHPFQGDGYHWSANHCEVVGNIYENPFLLKR